MLTFWLLVASFVAFAAWMLVPIHRSNQMARRKHAAAQAEYEAARARGECPPPINTLWTR